MKLILDSVHGTLLQVLARRPENDNADTKTPGLIFMCRASTNASGMELHGKNFIGERHSSAGDASFCARNPATGEQLSPSFHQGTEGEIDDALTLATAAFDDYRRQSPEKIADFLVRIAEEITTLGNDLIGRAQAETALPEARLSGERTRTINQIKMFADLIRDGSWVEARIDRPMPDRKPLPKPDIRRMLIPMGPVVVFGASNFPLAFSVAGGDTISALAAGNPVIVQSAPGSSWDIRVGSMRPPRVPSQFRCLQRWAALIRFLCCQAP